MKVGIISFTDGRARVAKQTERDCLMFQDRLAGVLQVASGMTSSVPARLSGTGKTAEREARRDRRRPIRMWSC
jgi:hypothetical protein